MNHKGFAPLILIIAVVAMLAIGGGGFWYYQKSVGQNNIQSNLNTKVVSDSNTEVTPESSTTNEPSSAPTGQTKQKAPTISVPTTIQSPTTTQPSPAPTLINGKTLEVRLAEASARLHTVGSGEHIRKSFPDIVLVYTDDGTGAQFPNEIIPFRYYYSSEADTTFNICKPELTTFICKGKLDRLIQQEDIDSGRCNLTEQLKGDPRL